ncbi:hypothetical protein AARAC_010052 [Aspergillus arachidicola]|uniref:Uncharacterized protein n=1 Tax=Aspergillus arachidicola TaxID=656916 RepID=A0A2G7FLD1_9EURO|nr:hypothetical protein AARAC_010052 [Aspergillus arachidicola]
MENLFPHPRRIVTGHDNDGKAIVVADSLIPCEPTKINCNFAVLYETHQFPEVNDQWIDPTRTRTPDLANQKGVVLRVVDFPPRTKTMFHRTESLDFGILHAGEITWFVSPLGPSIIADPYESSIATWTGTSALT